MSDEYKIPQWFPLDMAGGIFPAVRKRNWNENYRMSFTLKNEDVDPERLKQALEDVFPRFPSFFVSLRGGLFWYYLERVENIDNLRIEKEKDFPCRPINLFHPSLPALRILYDRRRFSLEIAHMIADGGGALVFIKALLVRYLQLGGIEIPLSEGITDLNEPPSEEELADPYRLYYEKSHGKLPSEIKAYLYMPPKIPDYLNALHGAVPLEDILPLAKARGLTVTEYLTCICLYAAYTADPKARRSRKPIRIHIPISLRTIFKSRSLRNFALYTRVGFYPLEKDAYSFDDIVELTRGEIARAASYEAMHRLLCQNMAFMNNPAFRLIPNALKRQFMRLGDILIAEQSNTFCLSNLGKLNLPPCAEEHVSSFDVLINSMKRLTSVVISDGRLLHMFFNLNTADVSIPREFFRFLAKEGVRVRVESNLN